MRFQNFLIAVAAGVVVAGCAAAALEEGIAIEGAEAGALEGAEAGAAASRIFVGEGLVEIAAERGVLRSALAELTANGTETAVLSVDEAGIIRAGGRSLARLDFESGNIIARMTEGERVVGGVRSGDLVELSRSGDHVVGEFHGFIPSRGVHLTPTSSTSTEVELLRPNVFVDVLELRDDYYLIRLADGQTAWIDADLAVLTLMSAGQRREHCPGGPGALVRQSGEVIPFEQCREQDGVFILATSTDVTIVDALDVRTILVGSVANLARERKSVALTGGEVVFGSAEYQNADVVRITGDHMKIVADAMRLRDNGPYPLVQP